MLTSRCSHTALRDTLGGIAIVASELPATPTGFSYSLLIPLANAAASPHAFSEQQASRHAHAPHWRSDTAQFHRSPDTNNAYGLLNLPLLGGICLKDDPQLALAQASGSRGNEHLKAGCESYTSLIVR